MDKKPMRGDRCVTDLDGHWPISYGCSVRDRRANRRHCSLTGEAKVQPAGSSLQYDAFEGMTLQQGDRLIVGQGGAQLRIKDTGDEVNLGEYSLLDISRLAGGPQENNKADDAFRYGLFCRDRLAREAGYVPGGERESYLGRKRNSLSGCNGPGHGSEQLKRGCGGGEHR